ncbi:MAG: DUF2452 domain-containing protein [Cyclobacteriaceae bacterium]
MTGNKVDITKFDFDKEREKIADFPGLIEFAHTVGSALIKPEDKGKIKGQALSAMHDQTDREYQRIMKDMRELLIQAQALKTRVNISERIYNAGISFKPVIHQIYHLYLREDGTDLLSMIAPNEWGKTMPNIEYQESVKLLADHTWEIVDLKF